MSTNDRTNDSTNDDASIDPVSEDAINGVGDEQFAGGDEAPLGGDETTEDELQADNPAEEDTLKTLDPDAPPA